MRGRSNGYPHGIPPYQLHSATSFAAAVSMIEKAATMRADVWRYLGRLWPDGATDDEIQEALGLSQNGGTPRRRELELMGLVRDSGKKRTTRSGRLAVVWVIVRVQDVEPQQDLFV